MVMLCQAESDTSNECTAYWDDQYQKDTDGKPHNIRVTQCIESDKATLPVGIIRRICTITDGENERIVEHL